MSYTEHHRLPSRTDCAHPSVHPVLASHREASCTFPRIVSLFLACLAEALGTDELVISPGPRACTISYNHRSLPRVFSNLHIFLLYSKTQSLSPVCLYYSIFLVYTKMKRVEYLDLWGSSSPREGNTWGRARSDGSQTTACTKAATGSVASRWAKYGAAVGW